MLPRGFEKEGDPEDRSENGGRVRYKGGRTGCEFFFVFLELSFRMGARKTAAAAVVAISRV